MKTGKGGMVWKLRSWCGGDPAKQVAQCKDLGLKWVSLKIVDDATERWENSVNFPNNQNADLLPATIAALKAAGIAVHGWGYTYGKAKDAPYASLGAAEAAKTVQMCKKHGITEFDVDAEGEYERTFVDMHAEAKAYMAGLRSGLPSGRFSLCAYRYPSVHGAFAWPEFLADIQVHTPQVYFLEATAMDAGAYQLRTSYSQLQALKRLPFVPIAPTYEHRTKLGVIWRASKVQLLGLFEQAKTLGCEGVGIWTLELASDEQLSALREFSWAVTPPPPVTMPQYLTALDAWARTHGFAGPQLPVA
jgi:hypothetical protein